MQTFMIKNKQFNYADQQFNCGHPEIIGELRDTPEQWRQGMEFPTIQS